MATRCDECNGEILVPAIGTIKGVAFNFCSPACRAEFARFSESVGHAMVIPAEPRAATTACRPLRQCQPVAAAHLDSPTVESVPELQMAGQR